MNETRKDYLIACLSSVEYLRRRNQGVSLATELVKDMEGDRAKQIHLLLEDSFTWIESTLDDLEHDLKKLDQTLATQPAKKGRVRG